MRYKIICINGNVDVDYVDNRFSEKETRPWRHIYHGIGLPRPKSHDVEIPRPKNRDIEMRGLKHHEIEKRRQLSHDIEIPKLKNHDVEIPRPKSHDIEFLWNSDPYVPDKYSTCLTIHLNHKLNAYLINECNLLSFISKQKF